MHITSATNCFCLAFLCSRDSFLPQTIRRSTKWCCSQGSQMGSEAMKGSQLASHCSLPTIREPPPLVLHQLLRELTFAVLLVRVASRGTRRITGRSHRSSKSDSRTAYGLIHVNMFYSQTRRENMFYSALGDRHVDEPLFFSIVLGRFHEIASESRIYPPSVIKKIGGP